MEKQSSTGTYIVIAIILIVAGGIYFYSKGSNENIDTSSLEVTYTPESTDATLVGGRVLNLLAQINSLKIDGTLFNNPAYKSLRDYSITIPEQNVGRTNPFAPIPGASPSSSSIRLPSTAR